jgi:hypothetical protein
MCQNKSLLNQFQVRLANSLFSLSSYQDRKTFNKNKESKQLYDVVLYIPRPCIISNCDEKRAGQVINQAVLINHQYH